MNQDKGWESAPLPALFGSSPGQWSAHDLAGMMAHWLGRQGQPLAVHIEDLHAADTASLDVLRHLVTQLRDWPVLVIGTYRTDELTRRHPLWHLLPEMQRYGAVKIQMRQLTREEVAELLDKMAKEGWEQVQREPSADARVTWADAAALSGTSLAEIADRVYARTSRLALFVRELTEPFIRTGRVPRPDDPLPETLQQAIDSRLHRLPAGALEVLETAALLGERFSYGDLAEVVAPMSEEDLSDALDAAAALHVIQPEDTRGTEMAFVHALYREFLLQHMRGARRRRCHARIAEVLAGRGDLDIAHHLSQAGDPRAAAYFCAAGDRARVLGASDQARARYLRALERLPEVHADRPEILLKLARSLPVEPPTSRLRRRLAGRVERDPGSVGGTGRPAGGTGSSRPKATGPRGWNLAADWLFPSQARVFVDRGLRFLPRRLAERLPQLGGGGAVLSGRDGGNARLLRRPVPACQRGARRGAAVHRVLGTHGTR